MNVQEYLDRNYQGPEDDKYTFGVFLSQTPDFLLKNITNRGVKFRVDDLPENHNGFLEAGPNVEFRQYTVVIDEDVPRLQLSHVFYHEIGHYADYEFSHHHSKSISDSQEWADALKRQIDFTNKDNVSKEASGLKQHLLGKEYAHNFDSQKREAFAEITAFYLAENKKLKGDTKKAEQLMAKAFPDLWPVYDGMFLKPIKASIDLSPKEVLKKTSLEITSYSSQNISLSIHAKEHISTEENAYFRTHNQSLISAYFKENTEDMSLDVFISMPSGSAFKNENESRLQDLQENKIDIKEVPSENSYTKRYQVTWSKDAQNYYRDKLNKP